MRQRVSESRTDVCLPVGWIGMGKEGLLSESLAWWENYW